MGLDHRIGDKFLHAGPGYGGSCFPKDTSALTKIGEDHGAAQTITNAAISVNENTKARMVEKIVALCDGDVAGKTLAVLGVTFKPNTDDMRDAPSLSILPALQQLGAQINVVDPHGKSEGEALLPAVTWYKEAYGAATGADAVVVLTEWNEFRGLDLARVAGVMRAPKMADLRNIFERDLVLSAGFKAYVGVGR